MTYDASDPKLVDKVRSGAKSREARRDEALRMILSNEQGRLWLHDLLAKFSPMSNPFSTDPLTMAFRCGETNVTQGLVADCHRVSAELYLQMMKENANAS
jgi:hypothetical protein